MSDEESIRERVIKVVSNEFDYKDVISDDAHFIEDFGADSLDALDLMMETEDEFNITFTDEEAEKFQTVGDLIRAVQAKLEN